VILALGLFFKLAFLYVWRSWRSTVVLGVMVFSAVAALVFLASMAIGTNDAMVRNSVGLFSGHIAGEDLPPNLSPEQLQVKGVAGVLLRRRTPVWLWHLNHMEAVLLYGIRPDQEKRQTALWKKTVAGRYPTPGEPSIYLSEALAQKLAVSVNSKIELGFKIGLPVKELKVCGIYRTGISYLDHNVAFCPLEVFPGVESPLAAAVFLEDGANSETVMQAYRSLPGFSGLKAWTDFMPDLRQLIDLNFVSMGIVMLLVFGVVSLGISCAFVIFILKNLREHGIMKAMGVLPLELAFLIFAQVTMLTLIASAAGAGAGAVAVAGFARTGVDLTAFTSHNQYFAVSGIIYPRLTSYSLILPPLLAIIFGKLAAIWPAVFIIRKKSAEILRSI
jgi:ABC-type lipoprotein release transport system permease subunit